MMDFASWFSKILEKIKILDKSAVFLTIYTVLQFGHAERTREVTQSANEIFTSKSAFAGPGYAGAKPGATTGDMKCVPPRNCLVGVFDPGLTRYFIR